MAPSALVGAIAIFVGFLGREGLTPQFLDKAFGLSDYVLKQVSRRVDAGYSSGMIFDNANRLPRQILFYAMKGQTVKVTLNASAVGNASLLGSIDGQKWERVGKIPDGFVQSDITEKLRFDAGVGDNVHSITIAPGILDPDAVITCDCLVLVYRQNPED